VNGGGTVSLTIADGVKQLQTAGAKITSQRIAIMKALEGRSDHPSAEQLYYELKPLCPKLSIATVYNTVQLLAQASLVRTLSIDDRKINFDPSTEPHGHFLCKECRKIIDIPLPHEKANGLATHDDIASIDHTEVFHYGACAECAEKSIHNSA